MAAGVASSVAGDIARDVVETALTQRFEQQTSGRAPTSGFVSRAATTTDDTGGTDGQPSGESVALNAEKHEDELLKFAMSDAFETRLMEFLEDRLLGEIERRGGRYGGGFA